GGITFNTSNWVSAASRDIYEFDINGAWYTNGYGFENRLDGIIFDDPEYGPISTDPANPPPPTQPRAVLASTPNLEVRVLKQGAPPKIYSGPALLGLELSFQTRYQGGTQYATRVRVTDVSTPPVGGDMYELHKLNLQTNELLAPICETSTGGDRNIRVYGDISIDVQTGAVTDVPGVFHLACTASAPGKSALYGYTPHDGPDRFRLSNRVIRADYCADGYPYTYPGNSLTMRDNFSPGNEGTSLADVYAELDGMALEAMWSTNGILCVDTPRVDTLTQEDVICPIKHMDDGAVVHNWRPPPCDGFVDPDPGATRFYSLTEVSE
ncbi:MAG: hypothetical protein KC468_30395, partial [Myxococcales bacterium]|nr:hypothetical protein [Myxococcales bacterium]